MQIQFIALAFVAAFMAATTVQAQTPPPGDLKTLVGTTFMTRWRIVANVAQMQWAPIREDKKSERSGYEIKKPAYLGACGLKSNSFKTSAEH